MRDAYRDAIHAAIVFPEVSAIGLTGGRYCRCQRAIAGQEIRPAAAFVTARKQVILVGFLAIRARPLEIT